MWKVTDGICLILLCPIAVRDFKKQSISVISLAMLAAGSMIQQFISQRQDIWLMIGGMGVGIGFLFLSKITEEGLGYGDSLGILILGIGLGLWKLLEVLTVTFFILFIGSVVIWCIRKKKNQFIPFFPFLVTGYFLVFLIRMS